MTASSGSPTLGHLILVPHDPARKPIRFDPGDFDLDPALLAWLGPLESLDARDQQQMVLGLLDRADLGRTHEERVQFLERVGRWARAAGWGTAAVMAWAVFRPRPYPLVIGLLVLIPLLALALLSAGRGAFSADPDAKNDPRPSLLLPLLGPGFVLMLRAYVDAPEIVDWAFPLLATALATLVLAGFAAWGDPELWKRPLRVAGVVMFLAPHAWGTIVLANAHLDRAPPVTYPVKVLAKRASSGKPPNRHLQLAAWGPMGEGKVDVRTVVYDAVEVGGEVCPKLRAGALGVRWYSVEVCAGPETR